MRIRPILLIALLVSPFMLVVPNASAISTHLEGFEDDPLFDDPSGDFYLYSFTGGGTAVVTNSPVQTGTKSFQVSDSGGAGTTPLVIFDLQNGGIDASFCNSGIPESNWGLFGFSFNLQTLPGVGISRVIQVQQESTTLGANRYARVAINDAGALTYTVATTIPSSFTSAYTIAVGQWYNVTMRSHDCSSGIVRFHLESTGGVSETVDVDGAGSPLPDSGAMQYIAIGETPGGGSSGSITFDNIIVAEAPDIPPTAIGSAAVASVTGLNGMAIDPTGTTLITQLDTGNSVSTFSAQTLGAAIGSDTVDCGTTQDRVDAIREYVAYLDCVGGDVKQLKIRAPANLGTETLPDYCEPGGDNCASTIAIDEDEAGCIQSGSQPLSVENVLKDIKSTDFAPIDYSTITEPESLTDTGSRAFAMAYSTNSGAVGVFGYTSRDDACDQIRLSNRPLPTISSVDDICTWQVISGTTRTTYLGVADNTVPPRVAVVSFSIDPEGFALKPEVGPFTTFSAYSGAESMGCAGSKILFGMDSRTVLYDFGTGSVLWDIAHSADGLNGVHLSGSGQWALVRTSSSKVQVIRANYTAQTFEPERVAELTIPTGTYFANFIGFNGANAWIGTTGSPGVIARFPISQITNATCDQASCIPTPAPSTPVPGDFTFGIFTTNPFGTGEAANAAWAFFLIVIAAFFGAILFGAIRKKQKRFNLSPALGAAIFGGLTYAICAVSGLLSGRVLFLSIVFIAGIIALYLWRR